jgi:O-6-methylguanine DNA methyltransferase
VPIPKRRSRESFSQIFLKKISQAWQHFARTGRKEGEKADGIPFGDNLKGALMYQPWPTPEEARALASLDDLQLQRDAGRFPQTGIACYQVPTFWGDFVLSTSAFGAALLFFPGGDDFEISDRLDYYGIAFSSSGRKMAVGVGLELMEYSVGDLRSFDTPVDLSYLSPFQQDILLACRKVPFGETATYGELAAMAGHPGKGGAAAGILRHNPLPVLIPCHRILPANRTLGAYCGHPAWKQHLLAHEGVEKALPEA